MQRRQTLLQEHNLKDHTGTFRDRRFGESDPTMSLEDRMLERYTRERQRGQGKKGMFNLEDDDNLFGDDDDGFALGGLTHGGRSVMDLPGDDFVAQGFGEDDEEETNGAIDRRQVMRNHFGGFGDEEEDEEMVSYDARGSELTQQPERKKTKQEVMSEIIAKSKEYKMERQREKEADAEMREELDENLDDIRALIAGGTATVKPEVQLPGTQRTAPAMADEINDDGYDQFVRSLAFDARAKPKDRTKTEEEQAMEEKERLEAAEAKRLRRMRGEDSEDEDGPSNKRRKGDRAPEADDLGDDFMGDVDEDGGISLLGKGITREAIEQDAGSDSESDSQEGDSDEEGSEDDEDGEIDVDGEVSDSDAGEFAGSDMEDLDSDAEEDSEEESEDELPRKRKDKGKGKAKAPAVKEIPYTFPCPATVEEFEECLEGLDNSALPIVVTRIRAIHHPSLAQGNKEKLQDFLGVLLDYILILASEDEPPFDSISSLNPHLAALVKLNPIAAAHQFLAKLTLMQKNLQRGLTKGPSSPDSKTLPGAAELIILRLIGTLWSTSDFSHPVAQAAELLIGQYLSQSRIRSTRDVASGLFLSSVISQYEAQSKRMVPEAINFIANSLLALLPRKKAAGKCTAFPDLLACDITMKTGAEPSKPAKLAAALTEDNEQVKSDLVAVALGLISTLATMSSENPGYIELFTPLQKLMTDIRVAKLAPALKAQIETATTQLGKQLMFAKQARAPLMLQDHKPVPIATYAPKFEADFAPGKHYDPDVERNAVAKLKAQYKKEKKGAMRELRKDNRFLAAEKAREQAAKDAEYNAKMRKAVGGLNDERAEEKQMEKEKKREKRRRG